MRKVRRLWQRLLTVPGVKRDVIAVAIILVAGLAGVGYLFAGYQWQPPWKDHYVFSAEFDRAPGVQPAARQEVRIAGVPVGKIIAAEPQDNGNARITMSIEPGHKVYSNARLVLRNKSPLNVMYVALNPGGPRGEPLPENDTIPVTQTERAIQPFELLDKLDARTRDAVTSLLNNADVALANAPQHLPAGLDATRATMDTFQPVVKRLQERRATIQQLVTAFSQIATAAGRDDERLARLTSSLQQTLGVLAERDSELASTLAQLPGFSRDIKTAMDSTSRLTGQLNPTLDAVHQAADKLPSTVSRLSKTVDSARRFMDAASPVVRKAKPVVADLRPLSRDLGASLRDLAPVTADLPSASRQIVPWLNDLAAFVYQTSSAFSLSDVNGGFGRGNFTLSLNNPSGGLNPDEGPKQGGGK